MPHRAVIFDLGGVVLGSPLLAIARCERELGLEPGCVNRVVVDAGAAGAWARLERGELDLPGFFPEFERECEAVGFRLSAAALMARIAEFGGPRPRMLDAIRRIRTRGLRVAALTNNWSSDGTQSPELRAHFDVFLESSVLGLRKPDPRIYERACAELGVEPPAVVFLDDIGRNLKPARTLGMATIKVEEPESALAELERLLGFPLT